MSKPAKKPPTALPTGGAAAAKPAHPVADGRTIKKSHSRPKQARVVAMLQSRGGATIAAMMKATGWQPHSVRGFLAGVVRKRLKFKLSSTKIEGTRIYRIAGDGGGKAAVRRSKSRAS
jgi:hypothetical protein